MLDDAIERKVPARFAIEDSGISLRTPNSRPAKPGAKRSSRSPKRCRFLISGSADLHGSTLNYIKDGGDFTRTNPAGRNIHFGIREHGMCAILNGVSLSRHFPRFGCDLSGLHRLLPRLDSARRALETAEHLHFHARLDRSGRGRSDPRAGRDGGERASDAATST